MHNYKVFLSLPKKVLAGRLRTILHRAATAPDKTLRNEMVGLAWYGTNVDAPEDLKRFEEAVGFSLSDHKEPTDFDSVPDNESCIEFSIGDQSRIIITETAFYVDNKKVADDKELYKAFKKYVEELEETPNYDDELPH
jgi:hypothetical protein